MARSLHASFERCCRLCAEEQDVTIMIFSEEAEAMLLQNKLNQYLLIEVDEDDKLPKNICIKCCSKLQTVCDFIDTARNAQVVLLNRSIELDQVIDNKPQLVPYKQDIKTEYNSESDNENTSTGMEISVDPMLVLQNSEDPFCSNHYETCTSIEDVTHLHDVDGDNVTIKLIRKGDVNSEETNGRSEESSSEQDSNAKPFPCTICKRSFFTELALKNHSWTHTNEDKDSTQTFKCSTCRDIFELKIDLINHLKKHKMINVCQFCGRSFRSQGNLEIHMTCHLPHNRAFTCKVCGRSYKTRSNLKTHSVTHSNERPFHCHICKKSFKRNQDLKFHINQHTGAKPYKCPFCDKSFASSGNCYSHRSRMHPGRRVELESKLKVRAPVSRENLVSVNLLPKTTLTSVKGIYKYQCTLCEHSFMRRDNFTYHMYQHTGEKPFQCSFCTDKFVTRRGLLIHHDRDHPLKDRPLALLSKNLLLK